MTALEAEQDAPNAAEPIAKDESATPAENPAAEGRREESGIDTSEVRSAHRAFHVYNSFYGEVNASNAAFGVAGGDRSPVATTGVLDRARVTEALRGFVPPAATHRALAVLQQHNLVVLVGPEGSGKRALAQYLLRTSCGEEVDLVAASPARGLGQLADLSFTSGSGYLVADHLARSEESAVRGYEADRLSGVLKGRKAHLVVTTTSSRLGPRHLPAYAVVVSPPDPVAVLRRHLDGTGVAAETMARVEDFVRTEQCPRVVARLGRDLVADPVAATDAMDNVPAEKVAEWFDRTASIQQLLSITALAIGGSQPERVHDVLVRGLRAHFEAMRDAQEAAPHVPWHEQVLDQRNRKHDLVEVVSGDEFDGDPHNDGWLVGRRIRFRRPVYRELVLRELHERYDDRLWHPVVAWVRELCGIDSKEEIQSALATALAVLARYNFTYIEQTYLTSWADGTKAERLTAAMVLWAMSRDSRLAPVALRTALEWGENRGLRRGVTSALALSGPLGLVFPEEAMERLCFLSLRAKRIGEVARVAMAVLLAVATATGGEATGRVLGMAIDQLDRATGRRSAPDESYVTDSLTVDEDDPDSERYEQGWNGRVACAARSLVLAVLEAEQPESSDLVAAMILREQPEHAGLLGRLWAAVLCSSPHRAAAIEALRRTLLALENEPAVVDAVARLGHAVWTAMPAEHRRLREPELIRAMTAAKRGTDRPARNLVSTLLAAFHAAPNLSWS